MFCCYLRFQKFPKFIICVILVLKGLEKIVYFLLCDKNILLELMPWKSWKVLLDLHHQPFTKTCDTYEVIAVNGFVIVDRDLSLQGRFDHLGGILHFSRDLKIQGSDLRIWEGYDCSGIIWNNRWCKCRCLIHFWE